MIIHSRDAAADTLEIMKEHGRDLGGVIHCFSYGPEMAERVSEDGVLSGNRRCRSLQQTQKKLKEVVKETSIDRIVLETDCPYLSPVPNRGKRNSSLNLPYVVDMIAELKGITAKEVMEKTWENAKALYRMTE